MKKNLILAIAAVVFAVGGAIASTFVASNVYVSGRQTSALDPIRCINTGVQCSATGTGICSVSVTVTGPVGTGAQTASSTGTHKTWLPATGVCQNIIFNESDIVTPIATGLSIYELD